MSSRTIITTKILILIFFHQEKKIFDGINNGTTAQS